MFNVIAVGSTELGCFGAIHRYFVMRRRSTATVQVAVAIVPLTKENMGQVARWYVPERARKRMINKECAPTSAKTRERVTTSELFVRRFSFFDR